MEKYRKKIERRCRLDGAVCAGVLALYLVLCRFTHTAGGTGKDVALGIVFGLLYVHLLQLYIIFQSHIESYRIADSQSNHSSCNAV